MAVRSLQAVSALSRGKPCGLVFLFFPSAFSKIPDKGEAAFLQSFLRQKALKEGSLLFRLRGSRAIATKENCQ